MEDRKNTWRNVDGGMWSALIHSFEALVLPKPDLAASPPLEVMGARGSGTRPAQIAPHLVVLDHVARSSGILYTHTSEHAVVLAITNRGENLLGNLTSFFSDRALRDEIRSLREAAPVEEADWRVGLFISRSAPISAVRGVISAVRKEGLDEFIAIRGNMTGYSTVALEGDGQIIVTSIDAYAHRLVGLGLIP